MQCFHFFGSQRVNGISRQKVPCGPETLAHSHTFWLTLTQSGSLWFSLWLSQALIVATVYPALLLQIMSQVLRQILIKLWPNLASKSQPNISIKILTKLQLQNLAWASISKFWPNLVLKVWTKFSSMTKLQLPNLQQTIIKTFLISAL